MSGKVKAKSSVSLRDVQPALGYGWRVALVILLVTGVSVAMGSARRLVQNETKPIPATATELNAISPALENGTFSYADDRPAFMGTLLPSWTVMTRQQQLAISAELRDGLAARNISSAAIFSGDALVLRIVDGKVYVE